MSVQQSLPNYLQHTDEVEGECPICCETPQKPVITTCKHTFCQECFLQWRECKYEANVNITCPMCRTILVTAYDYILRPVREHADHLQSFHVWVNFMTSSAMLNGALRDAPIDTEHNLSREAFRAVDFALHGPNDLPGDFPIRLEPSRMLNDLKIFGDLVRHMILRKRPLTITEMIQQNREWTHIMFTLASLVELGDWNYPDATLGEMQDYFVESLSLYLDQLGSTSVTGDLYHSRWFALAHEQFNQYNPLVVGAIDYMLYHSMQIQEFDWIRDRTYFRNNAINHTTTMHLLAGGAGHNPPRSTEIGRQLRASFEPGLELPFTVALPPARRDRVALAQRVLRVMIVDDRETWLREENAETAEG